MSVGDIDERCASSQELAKLLIDNPPIVRMINQSITINNRFQVPYVAGMSVDGRTLYIDELIKGPLEIGGAGRKYDVTPFIHDHEVTEYAVYRWLYLPYDPPPPELGCHHYADRAERNAVEAAGLKWEEYNAAIDVVLIEIGKRPLTNPPMDLALYPYSGKLLQQLIEMQNTYPTRFYSD